MKGLNYKVYCASKNIVIEDSSPALSFIGGISKEIYRIDNSIIEIIRVDSIEEIKINKGRSVNYIVLVDEINEKNINEIEKLIENNNVLVMVREKLVDKKITSIVYIDFIKNKINLKGLMNILRSEPLSLSSCFRKENYKMLCNGVERSSGIGEITHNILMNINYFLGCNELIVKIFSKKEYGLRDIYFIEDGIRDYIDINTKVKIEQCDAVDLEDEVFYGILAKTTIN